MGRHSLSTPALAAVIALIPGQCSAASEMIGSDSIDYLKFLWGMLIVLGLIFLLYGLLRKRFSVFTPGTHSAIKVIEMKPLGGRRALCLVEVRGKEYLLGVCDQSISPLAVLDEGVKAQFADALADAEAERQ